MKLTVDHRADALYLNLSDAPAAETKEVAPGILLDSNAEGQAVGVEMLHLSKRIPTPIDLSKVQLETVEA